MGRSSPVAYLIHCPSEALAFADLVCAYPQSWLRATARQLGLLKLPEGHD